MWGIPTKHLAASHCLAVDNVNGAFIMPMRHKLAHHRTQNYVLHLSLALSYLSYFAQFGFTRCLRNASLLFLVLSNFQPNSHTLAQCSFSAQTTRKSTTQMHRKYIRYLSCVTSEIILANEHGNKKTRIKTKLGMGKFLQIIEYECRACKSLQPTKSVQIKFIHTFVCWIKYMHAHTLHITSHHMWIELICKDFAFFYFSSRNIRLIEMCIVESSNEKATNFWYLKYSIAFKISICIEIHCSRCSY